MKVERNAKVKNNLSGSDNLSGSEGTVYNNPKGSELFKHYKEGRRFHMEVNDGSDVELDWGHQPEQIDKSWEKMSKEFEKDV